MNNPVIQRMMKRFFNDQFKNLQVPQGVTAEESAKVDNSRGKVVQNTC